MQSIKCQQHFVVGEEKSIYLDHLYYLTEPSVGSLGSGMWQVMWFVLVNNISAVIFQVSLAWYFYVSFTKLIEVACPWHVTSYRHLFAMDSTICLCECPLIYKKMMGDKGCNVNLSGHFMYSCWPFEWVSTGGGNWMCTLYLVQWKLCLFNWRHPNVLKFNTKIIKYLSSNTSYCVWGYMFRSLRPICESS